MNIPRSVAAAAVVAACVVVTSAHADADGPGECMSYSPLGFCLEWSIPGSDVPGTPGSGGGGDGPPCYWVTLSHDPFVGDETFLVDYGLEPPPDGVTVVWQAMECSDGSAIDDFRWVIPPGPREVAEGIRGRIAGTLPEPVVMSSPAAGVAAIVGVPAFVHVANWTGVVTAQECAGFCVTVRAEPSLTFTPGESGALPIACANSGTVYERGGASADQQAAAPGSCSHTYSLRTGVAGRPAEWSGTVSVSWQITWSATTGASGSLAPVTRSSPLPRAVHEVQTVVQGGQLP